MALTTRGDGTGAAYLVDSTWWNEYKDALTGVMTSQAFTLNYRPGSGTTPTLTLDGDGNGPLIKGLKTDHSTSAFSITSAGVLTLASNLVIAGTVTGVTNLTASGDLGAATGTFSGAITSNGKPVYYVDGNGTTAGTRIFIGTSSPGSPAEGDIWIKA